MLRSNIFKNLSFLTLIQISNYIIPLILLPVLSRRLGVRTFGLYSIIQAVVLLSAVIVDFGYVTHGVQRVAIIKGNKESICNLINSSVVLRLCISLCVILLTFFAISYLHTKQFGMNSFIFIGSYAVLSSINLIWYFQGNEKLFVLTAVTFLIRISSVFLTFIFVRTENDLGFALWLTLFPILGSAIYSYVYVYRVENWRLKLWGKFSVISEFRYGWSYFLPSLYSILFTNLGLVTLGFFQTPLVVGGYSASERLVKAVASLSGPVNQAIYPRVAASMHESREDGKKLILRYAKVSIPIFAAMTLVLILFGRLIVELVFGKFYASYSVVMFYLPLYILLSNLNTFIGLIYLTTTDRQKIYSNAFLVGLLFALFCYFFLVKILSFNAIAIGLVGGEIIISIFIYFSIKLEKNGRKYYA